MAAPAYTSWADASAMGEEPVRTVFITGFPPDTKERELQNLLRWWPGYESCQLTSKNDQPMGFALFSTQSMAFAARDALQGLVFDVDVNAVLRVEMAKKNLFRKKGVVHARGMDVYDPAKRLRVGDQASAYMGSSPASYVVPGNPYDPYNAYALSAAAAVGVPQVSSPAASAPRSSYGSQSSTPKVYKDNPPCNTLYVGNLSTSVNEAEVQQLFNSQPGFSQMKLMRQGINTCCFVQFVDVSAASAAHASLQGTSLTSSAQGPIRIQYSRNPLGQKRGAVQEMGMTDGEGASDAPPGIAGAAEAGASIGAT